VVHTIVDPGETARQMSAELRSHTGREFDPAEPPGHELLSLDMLTLTGHTGTLVDAPAHYGSSGAYGVPRTMDQMPLEWFPRPAHVLDITGADPDTRTVGVADIEKALARTGRRPRPLDIVLLHTGASAWAGTPRYFTDFTGLDGPATDYLLDLGVRVIGTDAFSLDAPFCDMIRRYHSTGDRSVLWPAHFAGRRREYCQIERLTRLDTLPPTGFRVACFPVQITGAGAGWIRAVALLDE
jgi:cyclase